METTGKIIQIQQEQRGESSRGGWVKQEFIIETEDQFPKKICFSLFGEDKVAALKSVALSDKVMVHFNAESREYNGRWYTDLRCWKLDKQIMQSLTQSPESQGNYTNNQTANTPAAPVYNTMPQEPFEAALQPDDDLPF